MLHVYDWLDVPARDSGEAIAKKFLSESCMPAIYKNDDWLLENPLFCSYKDGRYRCTGASRLGDVWLTDDFEQSTGYTLRVDVADCSDWSSKP